MGFVRQVIFQDALYLYSLYITLLPVIIVLSTPNNLPFILKWIFPTLVLYQGLWNWNVRMEQNVGTKHCGMAKWTRKTEYIDGVTKSL